ncbi:type II secretion system protein [Lentisphaera profundi]|uniref:Type II secretion system protein n=1 Tax=Lentisphaera profundi TaxID=1658616 RepID=A0ABY7VYQ7_9BACT|nr:type II secretion system protein [Lentisphaera profundi]WDE99411.1 type II secretion system protein [Lentisphaera profundi]
MTKNKFTLIELLVVIAIIGILASLLLPVLGKARKQSQSAVCKSNMKQMGVSVMMYLDDSEGFFMYGESSDGNAGAYESWDDSLGAYDGRDLTKAEKSLDFLSSVNAPGKGSDHYICPLDDIVRSTWPSPDAYKSSYAMTQQNPFSTSGKGIFMFRKDWIVTHGVGIINVTDVSNPSSTIAAGEEFNQFGFLGSSGSRYFATSNQFNGIALHDPRHQQKQNYLMVDGHVESLRYESTLATGGGSVALDGSNVTGSMWDATR